jgi:15-cis-phytoene synthase
VARDTSFYYSFLVLPAEKRRAIVAVWDFCRAVDDAVDEAPGEGAAREAAGRERIAWWRRELDRCFDGAAPESEQGRALVPLIGHFRLPRRPFEALIEGVEMDLGDRRYQTFAELYEYCIRVASAVGLICLNIFGTRDKAAEQYATDLGVALQLTNIIRDVPVDLAQGRLYLPLEELHAHGCTEADLRAEMSSAGNGVRSPSVRSLLHFQAERAREYYVRAARALPRADRRRLVAAEIMGAIYRALLRRIERADFDVFTCLVRVPRPRRAAIAAATWARTVLLP